MTGAAFFEAVRADPFGGVLTPEQRDGITAILAGWHDWFPGGDSRWLAYALATAFHETARTMQPVRERGRGVGRPYGVPDPETGHAYYGRGLIQITHKANYRKASALVDVDLVHEPDAALEMGTAVALLLLGMARGLYTGKAFSDYFNAADEEWVYARRIVNGLDRADKVARYGRAFDAALLAGADRTLRVAAPPLTGPAVVELQQLLAARRIDPGPIDGSYGPTTAAAVRRFQAARGLVADGVVGPRTWAALRG